MTRHAWDFVSQDECSTYYHRLESQSSDEDLVTDRAMWCNATYDNFMCWKPSPPTSFSQLPCPPLKGVDTTKLATKECLANGKWVDKGTNYSLCIIPEMREIMDKLYSLSDEDAQFKFEVARISRILETIGLTLSLMGVLTAILIFSCYRSLRNNRTRMHVNLFVAMMIQIIVRLTLYIDQYVTRTAGVTKLYGIDNTAILCESFYVLLEYARTAMFLWMFIEGHYLHSMITITVFSDRPNYKCYYVLGWGLPVLMTATWASVTAIKHTGTLCWWGYNFSIYFWILEGPRLAIIMTNLLFLLNILRVLITKLQASASTETQQVKKAVRAAIVLLPLLGITNSLQMVASPLANGAAAFAAWSYTTTFLTAFQGFFVALIYCFLNQEVRYTLRKSVTNYYYHKRNLPKPCRRYSMSTNVQSEAIPMTPKPVLDVICEAPSEKEAVIAVSEPLVPQSVVHLHDTTHLLAPVPDVDLPPVPIMDLAPVPAVDLTPTSAMSDLTPVADMDSCKQHLLTDVPVAVHDSCNVRVVCPGRSVSPIETCESNTVPQEKLDPIFNHNTTVNHNEGHHGTSVNHNTTVNHNEGHHGTSVNHSTTVNHNEGHHGTSVNHGTMVNHGGGKADIEK
uniref:PDF receptor-like n=2 Tax=Hirondellea gigas TaxID=1518452 RepID=A0A6A7G5Y6_9CRUS